MKAFQLYVEKIKDLKGGESQCGVVKNTHFGFLLMTVEILCSAKLIPVIIVLKMR